MKSRLRTVNLTMGILMIILFALSGQLMRHYYHNAELPDVERLYRRSRHLFLLMAALTQGGIGVYIKPFDTVIARNLQWAATVLTIVGSIFLVLAFCYEIPSAVENTPLSRIGLYSLLAGVVFHFGAFLLERNPQK